MLAYGCSWLYQRFELEIALSAEVGKTVLNTRQMNLVLVHTAMLEGENLEFLQYLQKKMDRVPVAILGDEAGSIGRSMALPSDVRCFDKPYRTDEVLTFILGL